MAHRLLLYQHLEIQVKEDSSPQGSTSLSCFYRCVLHPFGAPFCVVRLPGSAVICPLPGLQQCPLCSLLQQALCCCGVELYEKCIRPGNYSFAREAAYQSAKRLPFSYHLGSNESRRYLRCNRFLNFRQL